MRASRTCFPVSPPSDIYSRYFVGVSTDASLANAKANSLSEAIDKATQALLPGEPYSSIAGPNTLVKDAAVVQDTSFTYDSGSSKYMYYTLLRVSREIGRVPQKPLTFQQKGWHPADLT